MIDKETFQANLSIITSCSGGKYLQVYLPLLRYLKGDGDAAIVETYFLNLFRMKAKNRLDRKRLLEHDLWMRCPAKHAQKHLGMSEGRLRRSMNVVKKQKLLEAEHRYGNFLWVRVNALRLNDGLHLGVDVPEIGKRGNAVSGQGEALLFRQPNTAFTNALAKAYKKGEEE